jgi:hypothetical protein
MEKHPLHVRFPELQKSKEVSEAVEKRERLAGEKLPNDPTERIEAYLDRLENIFLNKDERVRERNTEMLREKIYDAFIIKRENIPESYFELQKRVARERGQAVEEISPEMRERMIDTIVEDQKASLDQWAHYLGSDDAMYPPWFKYFVFRNVVHLSQFDKSLGKFKSRTESTVAPFPDIYYEPLAQISDLYEKARKDKAFASESDAKADLAKKFPTLYAELIQKSLAVQMERQDETHGQWMKYKQGDMDEAQKLFDSLQGKGTGWCTAGESTARTQVESGDFYVYYTYDKSGNPTQPRVAIRMEENRIAEVRGILEHQQLEPQMTGVLDEKLKDFGSEADLYKKKSADMKLLTEIEKKTEANQPLIRDELVFLYEIESPIEGFGYEKDPRVEELRAARDPEADMPIVFDCKPEQIARNKEDLERVDIKAYVGELFPDFFRQLPPSVRHVYERFPEAPVAFKNITLGGKSPEVLEKEIISAGMQMNNYTKGMLEKIKVAGAHENVELVIVSVSQLGFPRGATRQEIYQKAQELGLELAPAEAGPQLRLQYPDQPQGEWVLIGMEPITVSGGAPALFDVNHDGAERWLDGDYGRPDFRWGADGRFAFLLRKVS